jgi:hypothetical protein
MTEYPSTLVHYDNRIIEHDPSRLLVCFQQPTTRKNAQEFAQHFTLALEDAGQNSSDTPWSIINHTPQRYWLRSRSGQAISDGTCAKLTALRSIDWIAPVYWPVWSQEQRARFSPLPNVLIVRYHTRASNNQIQQLEQKYRLKLNEARSRHLGPRLFYDLNRRTTSSYALRASLAKEPLVMATHYSSMPMHSPLATLTPSDDQFPEQWNLQRIGAERGWQVTTGSDSVVIGILDSGCNMAHEDLVGAFDGPGYNADTGEADGSDTGTHGTSVTGIAAARINNDGSGGTAIGIAGIAGGCRVHVVAVPNYTDDEVDRALREAVDEAGVSVINMSFRDDDHAWDRLVIDDTLDYAHGCGVFLCSSAGNLNRAIVEYPALHPRVIAVGAIDDHEQRAQEATWGSSYGMFLDLVAPGVGCPATTAAGGYAPFGGTSAAAPHVAALAALLRSAYPTLSHNQVRHVIEQTCEKIRPDLYTYAVDERHPNGTWNEEVGYGLISIDRALHYADCIIRDHPDDDGSLPSNAEGEIFWDSPDIGIRHEDDGVFGHDGAMSRGETNYVYLRVTNLGPHEAQNVAVLCRAVAFAGTEFEFDADWASAADESHIDATAIDAAFSSIPAGDSVIARFSLSATQVDSLHNWEISGWHPCILAQVRCDNDYNETVTGQSVWNSNNLAQKNVSTMLIVQRSGAFFPFLSGHPSNVEPYFELVIDRHALPSHLELLLDPHDSTPYFPRVNLTPPHPAAPTGITFLERTRLGVSACGCEGILTLEAGSTFSCQEETPQISPLQGAEFVTRNGRRLIAIRNSRAIIRVPKHPGAMKQCVLRFEAPGNVNPGTQYRIDVAQTNVKGRTVGGVTLLAQIA